jgi:uncharacterized protein (DUF1330 family)
MSAYFVANFSVLDHAMHDDYRSRVAATLAGYEVEVLVADADSTRLEGGPGAQTVVLRFASEAVLDRWYRSPAYQAILPLRLRSTTGLAVMARSFERPSRS